MLSAIDAFVEEARIVMNPTRATPIISAAAVAEVRLGLRMAFSRASVPRHALQAGQGRAQHPAERAGQDRAEHGHAEEHQRHAEADGHERRVAAGEEALGDGRPTERGDDGADDGPAAAAAGAVDGDVPHGGHGGHLRRPGERAGRPRRRSRRARRSAR